MQPRSSTPRSCLLEVGADGVFGEVRGKQGFWSRNLSPLDGSGMMPSMCSKAGGV